MPDETSPIPRYTAGRTPLSARRMNALADRLSSTARETRHIDLRRKPNPRPTGKGFLARTTKDYWKYAPARYGFVEVELDENNFPREKPNGRKTKSETEGYAIEARGQTHAAQVQIYNPTTDKWWTHPYETVWMQQYGKRYVFQQPRPRFFTGGPTGQHNMPNGTDDFIISSWPEFEYWPSRVNSNFPEPGGYLWDLFDLNGNLWLYGTHLETPTPTYPGEVGNWLTRYRISFTLYCSYSVLAGQTYSVAAWLVMPADEPLTQRWDDDSKTYVDRPEPQVGTPYHKSFDIATIGQQGVAPVNLGLNVTAPGTAICYVPSGCRLKLKVGVHTNASGIYTGWTRLTMQCEEQF